MGELRTLHNARPIHHICLGMDRLCANDRRELMSYSKVAERKKVFLHMPLLSGVYFAHRFVSLVDSILEVVFRTIKVLKMKRCYGRSARF